MARKKKQKKSRERVIKVRLLHRRLDVLISRFGKRFKRLVELEKRAEKARFGRLSLVRSVLTDEKMRLLREIKESSPDSIYELAKALKRDIKSVRGDLKQLVEAGFINLQRLKKKKVQKVKPVLAIDKLNIIIEFA